MDLKVINNIHLFLQNSDFFGFLPSAFALSKQSHYKTADSFVKKIAKNKDIMSS
jgi:hypothetical protein